MHCNVPGIYCTQSPEFLWQEAGQLGQVARTGKQDEGIAIAFDSRMINSLLLCNQLPPHTRVLNLHTLIMAVFAS